MTSSNLTASLTTSASLTVIFWPSLRFAKTATPFPTSLGPISTLSGMPFISCSANFQPGLLSESSNLTLTPAFSKAALYSLAFFITSGFFCMIGTITTWTGATLGGSTNPLSSPCTIIIEPKSLVETPQDVWCGVASFWSFVWKEIPNALANPSPK